MRRFKVTVNGVSYNVEVEEEGGAFSTAPSPAVRAHAPVHTPVQTPVMTPATAPKSAASTPPVEVAAGDTPIVSPMPGKVIKVISKAQDKVNKGDVLMILEAMKMQNEISAPVSGTVKSLNVEEGQSVKPGEVMAVITA
ncbi:MAG: gcdC [Firmicutes bacterium]|nr:gcdC [Bacillota bacterium]